MKAAKKQPNKNPILILNASPNGRRGNCAQFLKSYWPKEIPAKVIHLAQVKMNKSFFVQILEAPAVVVITGTYWDSWGSPLQKFLEAFTAYEGHPHLIGKPVACVVLMHSVGGKSILSRLQGVLNTFGFLIPPMSGMVYSLVSQLSTQASSSHADDFWSPQDLPAILQNLQVAVTFSQQAEWLTWPVDHKSPQRLWLKEK